MFKGKRVLVAGGTGLIGRPLVELLMQQGAQVRIASLDDPSMAHKDAEFVQVNLRFFENCLRVCQEIDYVFNLLCVKGSPAMTRSKPASFFIPMLQFNTHLMEAARQAGAKGYLFASSVAVYAQAEVLREDDVWKTFPTENDKFAGWAKRMGELQAEAYGIEYGWKNIAVVRPANVYGPYDVFEGENAMVVPSLIKRAVDGENPLRVWGDGSQIRDFIHAKDVARGMLFAAEKLPGQPVNLGSGTGVSIRNLVEVIVGCLDKRPEVIWDVSKPSGDKVRLMDVSRISGLGFKNETSLREGIQETVLWYQKNRGHLPKGYNIFQGKN